MGRKKSMVSQIDQLLNHEWTFYSCVKYVHCGHIYNGSGIVDVEKKSDRLKERCYRIIWNSTTALGQKLVSNSL